jgi:hypothetical protein
MGYASFAMTPNFAVELMAGCQRMSGFQIILLAGGTIPSSAEPEFACSRHRGGEGRVRQGKYLLLGGAERGFCALQRSGTHTARCCHMRPSDPLHAACILPGWLPTMRDVCSPMGGLDIRRGKKLRDQSTGEARDTHTGLQSGAPRHGLGRHQLRPFPMSSSSLGRHCCEFGLPAPALGVPCPVADIGALRPTRDGLHGTSGEVTRVPLPKWAPHAGSSRWGSPWAWLAGCIAVAPMSLSAGDLWGLFQTPFMRPCTPKRRHGRARAGRFGRSATLAVARIFVGGRAISMWTRGLARQRGKPEDQITRGASCGVYTPPPGSIIAPNWMHGHKRTGPMRGYSNRDAASLLLVEDTRGRGGPRAGGIASGQERQVRYLQNPLPSCSRGKLPAKSWLSCWTGRLLGGSLRSCVFGFSGRVSEREADAASKE